MLRRRRKTDYHTDGTLKDSARFVENNEQGILSLDSRGISMKDYLKFTIYCMLLAVPLYAITMSILDHNWIMVFIDALIVPVGFVHGILLLLGYFS